MNYPHIEEDPQGTLRIAGSRYKVLHLAGEHYHFGWSAEELLRQHPDLRPAEVYAALTYFHDHYSEMVRQLHEVAEKVEAERTNSSFSREELLLRKRLAESA